MQLISKEPLTIDELKKLNEFLSSPHSEATPMSLTASHGFLTAILSAPNLIMPSKWQSILFGGHPNFDSMEHASSIIGLIGRFNNQISNELRSNDNFEPFIFDGSSVIPYQDASYEAIAEWCQGYIKGSKLDQDWRRDEKAVVLLFPFGVLSGEFNIKGQKDNKGKIIEDDALHKEIMKKKLPIFIKDLFNGFQEHRKMIKPGVRIQDADGMPNLGKLDHIESIKNPNKIGRNELCSCGSGKKYKKCCIASDKSIP